MQRRNARLLSRSAALATVIATAVALAAPVHAAVPNITAATLKAADTQANYGDWPSHGRTWGEQRFSPLDKINADNVGKLGLAWQFKIDIDRGLEATPLVIDGVMYTTGPFSIVYALDAVSGKLLWKYDPKVDRARAAAGCCDAVNRGVAAWGDTIYVGALDGRLVAIHAKTGKKAWEVDTLINHQYAYTITGAPRVVKGKVVIGNGGADMTGARGYVSAYDAKSGKLAWRFYTVPGDPKKPPEDEAMAMAQKTWFGDAYYKIGGGGTAWDSFAYDPELNLLYIGVGNGLYWNIDLRSAGKGDNLFLSSIVAVNADTGKYVWHYQTTPGDMWDYTATQHMILADIPVDGKPTKVLMQAPKNGFFYVLDRATGKLISAEKYAPATWASHVDMATGRPVVLPESDYRTGPKLIAPAILGAHSWHPMSYSPKTGYVYIPMQDTVAQYSAAPAKKQAVPNIITFDQGVELAPPPEDYKIVRQMQPAVFNGKLIAWDPVKQKAAWSVDYPSMPNGGTLSTAGNLVFQGTAGGRVRAYAADSGKLLWDAPANTGVVAAPVTFTVKGEQYVTFMAGWGGVAPLALGAFAAKAGVRTDARILTYKLGGTAKLPPPLAPLGAVPDVPTPSGDETQVAQGRKVYNDICARCHGFSAVGGGVTPDLRYLGKEKHAQFAGIVRGARADKGMPAFDTTIVSNDDLAAIQQYLIRRSLDLKAEQADPPAATKP